MRRKTHLSPEDQWDRTATLVDAKFGPPGCYALVRQKPGYPMYEEGRMQGEGFDGEPISAELYLVQARVSTRLFLAGDVFVAAYSANDVRNPIYGRSSRGYKLDYYWVGLFRSSAPRFRQGGLPRFHRNRVVVEWVELPGRLVGKFPTDPDVRSFVTATLRAEGFRERVGSYIPHRHAGPAG